MHLSRMARHHAIQALTRIDGVRSVTGHLTADKDGRTHVYVNVELKPAEKLWVVANRSGHVTARLREALVSQTKINSYSAR